MSKMIRALSGGASSKKRNSTTSVSSGDRHKDEPCLHIYYHPHDGAGRDRGKPCFHSFVTGDVPPYAFEKAWRSAVVQDAPSRTDWTEWATSRAEILTKGSQASDSPTLRAPGSTGQFTGYNYRLLEDATAWHELTRRWDYEQDRGSTGWVIGGPRSRPSTAVTSDQSGPPGEAKGAGGIA